ncbi:LysR family substrate-binding domain-containing protein [Pseudonocardia sichuanensis]
MNGASMETRKRSEWAAGRSGACAWSRHARPALLEQRVDVGIGRDLEAVAGLRVSPVRRERLVAALPREHPLHRRRRLHLRELRDDPFVHLPRERVPRAWDRVWAMCRREGFVPQRAMEAHQFVTLLALVAAGIGVAVVPESVRTLRRDRVGYVGIDDPEAWSEITMAVRVKERNPVVPGFVELLSHR